MRSTIKEDVQKILDLMEQMTNDIKADCEDGLKEGLDFVLNPDSKTDKERLEYAKASLKNTLEIDARNKFQSKLTEAIRNFMDEYFHE